MPPRQSLSHLQGILEMPGFKGFPTGGNMKSGFSSQEYESIKPFEIPQARIMPKLNNGKRWVHPGKEMPLHNEDIPYRVNPAMRRNNAIPLSKPSTETHKANNPETASYMNPKSVPFYQDLADAQKQADVQRALSGASHEERGMLTLAELKEAGKLARVGLESERGVLRLSEKKPYGDVDMSFLHDDEEKMRDMFDARKHVNMQEKIAHLLNKGFTEDEIADYLKKQREHDIEKEARMPISQAIGVEQVLASIRASHTGMDATGIVPTGLTQNVAVQESVLRNRQGRVRSIQAVAPPTMQQPETEIDEVQSLQASITSAREMARREKIRRIPGQTSLDIFLKR